jgi:hypothetical protein
MDTACPPSHAYDHDPVSVFNCNDWRAWRAIALTCFGAEPKSARMKSSGDGFVAAKETLPG